ncbi:ASCH domain-containing protein [Phyllobacterium endophyticum]|uniref:ASCH domain-containing protein n=1 Tax=Phyllobacterium endophyticum TaxID=1149773 RepID=UPI0011C722B4|nr:ASCH domain-containing protein [Phyllobacterium endophyticum]TXR50497.1 ASCH domain-containing protein [Phyllobacterium endophyticum]
MTNLDFFKQDFVLSIKPEYATRIVDGLKKVELRRRFPYGTATDAKLFIYATVPLQAVLGYATIEEVKRLQVNEIWRQYHEVAYIDKPAFDEYYGDLGEGYVLVLRDPVKLSVPVPLEMLKAKLKFTPPQSFTYADDAFRKIIYGQ